jgi:hypothetical protein
VLCLFVHVLIMSCSILDSACNRAESIFVHLKYIASYAASTWFDHTRDL